MACTFAAASDFPTAACSLHQACWIPCLQHPFTAWLAQGARGCLMFCTAAVVTTLLSACKPQPLSTVLRSGGACIFSWCMVAPGTRGCLMFCSTVVVTTMSSACQPQPHCSTVARHASFAVRADKLFWTKRGDACRSRFLACGLLLELSIRHVGFWLKVSSHLLLEAITKKVQHKMLHLLL